MKLFLCSLLMLLGYVPVKIKPTAAPGSDPLMVLKCHDFTVTGKGSDPEWSKAQRHVLSKLDSGGAHYETMFKIMYSAKGIYVLFTGRDNRITTTYTTDFSDLFRADVFEVFFHTDTTTPIYLEYEINALEKELVLMVPNLKGRSYGWLPFHYSEKQVKKKVYIEGGKMEPGASIRSWSAEIFFPYVLFNPLGNIPPVSGTIWNANFYRLDYDTGSAIKWAWAPVDHSFHEFRKFHPIVFE